MEDAGGFGSFLEIGLEWRSSSWMGKELGLLLEMVCSRMNTWCFCQGLGLAGVWTFSEECLAIGGSDNWHIAD